jgi:hypothetical protein
MYLGDPKRKPVKLVEDDSLEDDEGPGDLVELPPGYAEEVMSRSPIKADYPDYIDIEERLNLYPDDIDLIP